MVTLTELLANLPPEPDEASLFVEIPREVAGRRRKLLAINDIHYVAVPTATSDTLQPASETPFAQDRVFGYKTAYLPAWIEEKSGGYWKADQVMSIGLKLIRQGGPEAVAAKLQTVEGGIPVVISAAGYGDLAVIVLGLLRAEAAGKRFL